MHREHNKYWFIRRLICVLQVNISIALAVANDIFSTLLLRAKSFVFRSCLDVSLRVPQQQIGAFRFLHIFPLYFSVLQHGLNPKVQQSSSSLLNIYIFFPPAAPFRMPPPFESHWSQRASRSLREMKTCLKVFHWVLMRTSATDSSGVYRQITEVYR